MLLQLVDFDLLKSRDQKQPRLNIWLVFCALLEGKMGEDKVQSDKKQNYILPAWKVETKLWVTEKFRSRISVLLVIEFKEYSGKYSLNNQK